MNQDTPAVKIGSKDLARNQEAFRECLLLIQEPIRTVLDVRYGLGGWAREIERRFPEAIITGYEQDDATFEKSYKAPNATVYRSRFEPTTKFKLKHDLVVADFNVVTRLKRDLVDSLVASVECRYLIFTDVACCKLHLNYRSYGVAKPDGSEDSLHEYWHRFRIEGFAFLGYRKNHHAASTGVFINKNSPS